MLEKHVNRILSVVKHYVFREQLLNCSFNIIDEESFFGRLERLKFVWLLRDCTEKRKITWFNRQMANNIAALYCLSDDVDYFNKNEKVQTIDYCLAACLIGATKVAESLFDGNINPKDFKRIISAAMCSGLEDWVCGLIERYHVDITDREYQFEPFANDLKSKRYQDLLAEKRKTKAIATSAMFPTIPLQRLAPQISQRLLQFFDEFICGELESLASLSEKQKQLLLSACFDAQWSVSDIAQYALELGISSGERFAIIHACLVAPQWGDAEISLYKKYLFDPLTESSEGSGSAQEKTAWLKVHARQLVRDVVGAKGIVLRELSAQEAEEKNQKLTELCSQARGFNFDKDAEQVKKELEDFMEFGDELDLPLTPRKIAVPVEAQQSLLFSAYQLRAHAAWKGIYGLVQFTKNRSKQRDEEKMAKVLEAIFYKEAKGVVWRKLPQDMEVWTTVRHYYYQWKNDGTLEQIRELLLTPELRAGSSLSNLGNN